MVNNQIIIYQIMIIDPKTDVFTQPVKIFLCEHKMFIQWHIFSIHKNTMREKIIRRKIVGKISHCILGRFIGVFTTHPP